MVFVRKYSRLLFFASLRQDFNPPTEMIGILSRIPR
jgi:hypothetical protein